MKRTRFITLFLVTLLVAALPFSHVAAKLVAVPQGYMFGFAASFNDSIVYFTDLQTLDSVWIESKSKFLQRRDGYSHQLRDYLSQQLSQPHRTCLVIFNTNRKKAEKQYQKMRRLYANPKSGRQQFDVRQLKATDFRFTVIDLSEEIAMEEEFEAEQKAALEAMKAQKSKKREKKK